MRILLINPYYPISETPSPPTALALLAGVLRASGHDAVVRDYVVFPYSAEDLDTAMERFQPHMVGITAVTMTVRNALAVANDVKRIAPDVFTVMGGPHVTFRAEKTLAENPSLDAAVLGEGEATLLSLATALENGRSEDLSGVAGLCFRDSGGIRVNDGKRTPVSLAELPRPAYDLLPLGRYRALGLPVNMITSRGCPHRCIFCVGRKMCGPGVRYFPPEKAADEMRRLGQLGFHQINVADDLFTANEAHCLAFCREIGRRGVTTPWTAFARVDTVTGPLLSAMRRAGCRAVSFGVESADPGILKTVRKGITLDKVPRAVRLCVDAGIAPHASFVLGLPGETKDTIARTVAFTEELKTLGASSGFHILAPFPGTEVREEAEKYGIRILTSDWSAYDANAAVTETDGAKAGDLNAVAAAWKQEFDDYLAYVERQIRRGEATQTESETFLGLVRCIVAHDMMMGRFLEKLPPVPKNGVSFGDAFESLVQKAADSAPRHGEYAESFLKRAVERGDIALVERNGALKWKWADLSDF